MAQSYQLDHTVINCRYDMDAGEKAVSDLGFQLTERGYHTLGSINHLAMFGTDYLELIGLPKDMTDVPSGRPDIETAAYGINGLVFKTSDADATFAHLKSLGMDGQPVKAFSRPVTVADGTFDASFRTTHVRPDLFPGGRVYFCEHGTPELVWRPEWQDHPNGTTAMPEFVVASENHEKETRQFAALLQTDVSGSGDTLSVGIDGCTLTIMSPAAYSARYGDLASSVGDRISIFGAMVMKVKDLAKTRAALQGSGATIDDTGSSVIARIDAFDSVIEFIG